MHILTARQNCRKVDVTSIEIKFFGPPRILQWAKNLYLKSGSTDLSKFYDVSFSSHRKALFKVSDKSGKKHAS